LKPGLQWWLSAQVRFSILGPIEVHADDGPLPLGGRRQRSVLAALLLAPNAVVSRDELIAAAWDERPPSSVQQSLDSYVSRLRRVVGSERVERHSPGYLIRIADGELDLQRFEALVAQARDADPGTAAELLREALELWRGPALADLRYEPFAQEAARRLEEQRLEALEIRIDSDLAAGRDGELVPELEALVAAHPLRERFAGQLMLALYRAGRQADALAVFQAARRELVEGLGLEPGAELRGLQEEILRQDPRIGGKAHRTPAARSAHRRRIALGAVVASLAAAVVVAIALPSGSSRHTAPDTTDRLVAISPSSKRIGLAVALPDSADNLASGAGSLWLSHAGTNTVSRVDPVSGRTVDRIPIGGEPGQIVSADGAIWVASTLGGTVSRIDPSTDTVTQTIRLGGANPTALAYGDGLLWIGDPTAQTLLAVDVRTGTLRRSLSLGVRPAAVAVADHAVWIAAQQGSIVEKRDPLTGRRLASVAVGQGPSALVTSAHTLWSANTLDGTVSRIDPQRARVTRTIAVGSVPSAMVMSDGRLWVANASSSTLVGVDPDGGRVSATIRVGGQPSSLARADGRLWVGTGAASTAHRGGTLRLVTSQPWRSVDPAFYNQVWPTQLMGLAYDTLVTFNRVDGPRGLHLVPDLAVALPATSRGGTTFTFRLRPGIRYSDGRPVRAGDFRRAIERLFRVGSPGVNRFAGIVGTKGCRVAAPCDLARGIATDDRAGIVSFHLEAPQPDFPYELAAQTFAAPIPPGTPGRDMGATAIPGTGPYRIVHSDLQGTRLVRNPRFREWSRAAQPDGLPDAIVWRFAPSHEAVVMDVAEGRADWTFDGIPPAQLQTLVTRNASQLHINPGLIFEFIPLNTHRAPFDDVRVRRALNYAIDRRKIARMYGGPTVATPSCQPLAPRIPGYRRYCPYTRDARPSGAWSGPDLARARALVAASGRRGARVDVWGTTNEIAIPTVLPAYIAHVLRSIGFRVRLHIVPYEDITPAMRRRIQLSVDGDWAPDYPAASSYLPEFFGCHGGTSNGYVCDRALDQQMRAATVAQLAHPRRAAALWTAVDHKLVDEAMWVPTVALNAVELVSKRLAGYQFNPVTGFLADQAWLR
jgi:ABC-type transport system substrate-binding protein/DNA-binding SARP family transcriptional activator/DNA-binding beta-propeller fold protein YncE